MKEKAEFKFRPSKVKFAKIETTVGAINYVRQSLNKQTAKFCKVAIEATLVIDVCSLNPFILPQN